MPGSHPPFPQVSRRQSWRPSKQEEFLFVLQTVVLTSVIFVICHQYFRYRQSQVSSHLGPRQWSCLFPWWLDRQLLIEMAIWILKHFRCNGFKLIVLHLGAAPHIPRPSTACHRSNCATPDETIGTNPSNCLRRSTRRIGRKVKDWAHHVGRDLEGEVFQCETELRRE